MCTYDNKVEERETKKICWNKVERKEKNVLGGIKFHPFFFLSTLFHPFFFSILFLHIFFLLVSPQRYHMHTLSATLTMRLAHYLHMTTSCIELTVNSFTADRPQVMLLLNEELHTPGFIYPPLHEHCVSTFHN